MVLLFVLYIVVTFLYIPFVPVYKGFIGIIQFYRSVSPSDFHRALMSSYGFRAFGLCTYFGCPFKGSFIYSLFLEYFDMNCRDMI